LERGRLARFLEMRIVIALKQPQLRTLSEVVHWRGRRLPMKGGILLFTLVGELCGARNPLIQRYFLGVVRFAKMVPADVGHPP